MKKISLVIHFFVSVLIAYFFACIFHTQMVIAGLTDIDVVVDLSSRVFMSTQDFVGLALPYGSVVLVGLLIAFLIAKGIKKFTPIESNYIYIVAGGLAMLVILLAMQPILGVTLLAGARTSVGILLQMLAGAIGGIAFVQMRGRGAKT